MTKHQKSIILNIYDWAETLLFALATVIIIFTFVLKVVNVSGDSMRESFHNGDKLIVSGIGYTPAQGDVVVVDVTHNLEAKGLVPNAPYIKRVIATEGQTVNIDPFSWTVYVDGEPIEEPYVYHCNNNPMHRGSLVYPYTVPEGSVFVMGDNRNGSSDSRSLGAIESKYILGKVYLRLMPDFGVIE